MIDEMQPPAVVIRKQLLEDLKGVLRALSTRLTEEEVVEITRLAWRDAVVEDVQES
jgi:hypothetical protein